MFHCAAAVQQERKPPEPKEIRPTPILGSPAHRIFIRKEDEGLDSPISGFLNKAEVIMAAFMVLNILRNLLSVLLKCYIKAFYRAAAMQAHYSHNKAICLSVCPSHACTETKQTKFCRHSYTTWKIDHPSFMTRRMVSGGDIPFYLKFWAKLTHTSLKMPIFVIVVLHSSYTFSPARMISWTLWITLSHFLLNLLSCFWLRWLLPACECTLNLSKSCCLIIILTKKCFCQHQRTVTTLFCVCSCEPAIVWCTYVFVCVRGFQDVQARCVTVKPAWETAADRPGHICPVFQHCQSITEHWWVACDNPVDCILAVSLLMLLANIVHSLVGRASQTFLKASIVETSLVLSKMLIFIINCSICYLCLL